MKEAEMMRKLADAAPLTADDKALLQVFVMVFVCGLGVGIGASWILRELCLCIVEAIRFLVQAIRWKMAARAAANEEF